METRELRGHYRHKVSAKLLRKSMLRVCRKLGITPPTLKFRRLPRCGVLDSDFDPPRLTLDKEFGRNFLLLAHELAHHIVWTKYGSRAQDHGPTWVKIYIRILHCLRVIPEVGMRAVCRQYGIKAAR